MLQSMTQAYWLKDNLEGNLWQFDIYTTMNINNNFTHLYDSILIFENVNEESFKVWYSQIGVDDSGARGCVDCHVVY